MSYGLMFWLLVFSVEVALMAAFVVVLLKKWGIAEWMQVHGNEFVSQLFSCDFCMSWWVSVVIAAAGVLLFNDLAFLLAPVLATPIARYIV